MCVCVCGGGGGMVFGLVVLSSVAIIPLRWLITYLPNTTWLFYKWPVSLTYVLLYMLSFNILASN